MTRSINMIEERIQQLEFAYNDYINILETTNHLSLAQKEVLILELNRLSVGMQELNWVIGNIEESPVLGSGLLWD